ncbi:MAG: nucleotidyl transferase AbiEii/AbiGii toxin family protein, partial [Terrimicrobiaceae bacterium]
FTTLLRSNKSGVKIKFQVSIRERPILPVFDAPQLEQRYFRFLDFEPAPISSLMVEEVIAEKIRAASQRSKIRDLYDLAEISSRPLNKEMVRSLAVLKLWQSGRVGLDFGRFRERIESGDEYDVRDLQNLLRRDQQPDLPAMIARVCSEFRFLDQLSETERALANDSSHCLRKEAEAFRNEIAQGR